MKRTELKKHLAAVLLVLCLLAASALPAFATSASIRLTDSFGNATLGSIHITLYDTANDKALRGGELTVYRVAEVQRNNGDLSFEYCGDFTGCSIDLGDLSDSTLAGKLQAYLPESAEGTAKTVADDGTVTFDGLELGLYLVVQTKASSGYKPVNSFLVSLPMAEDGEWLYDVDATPKVGASVPEEPVTPPVVPVVPPIVPTVPEVPELPDLPITPENPDAPVAPGTPDNPVLPGHPDAPVLPGSPDSPVLPGHPDNSVMNGLPQTGQLNWPVPVMAISGLMLFSFGWALNRKKTI